MQGIDGTEGGIEDTPGEDRTEAARERLLDAALPNVVFDGWSQTTLRRAASETGDDPALVRLAFPRGGIDMVLAFDRRIDRELARALDRADLGAMRTRDKIGFAVGKRIELVARHREAVRRGASLLALPLNAPEGARAVWRTADLIWTRCGDMSTDYNWYSKRAILASVISSTMLYWLGDESADFTATRAFLDRRIENVMRFEKGKARVTANPVARAVTWGPRQFLRLVTAGSAHRQSSQSAWTRPASPSSAKEWPPTGRGEAENPPAG